MSRTRRWILWLVLPLLLFGSCGLFSFLTCQPPDRVRVFVENIPPDSQFLCLAAITDKGPVSLPWSPSGGVVPPIEMHPAACTWSYLSAPAPPRLDWHAFVRWRFGQKYGVVTRSESAGWRVAWFPAADVLLRERSLFGGGRAEFDCSKAEFVPVDADTLRSLGLQDVKIGR